MLYLQPPHVHHQAFINITGHVGTHQDPNRHWKRDGDNNDKHYYRLMSNAWMIQEGKRLGIAEARAWTINGDTAAIVTPITHRFQVGTTGRTYNTWYDADSEDCLRMDPAGRAGLRAAADESLVVGEQDGLPVIKALRVAI